MPDFDLPQDHQPSELTETTYDVIVVGAGSTGENVADYATRGGCTVLLVEAELFGGECSYWACMPSKALLRPLEAMAEARAVGGAREAVTGRIDPQAVFARRDEFTSHWKDNHQVDWANNAGIALARGRGRLTGVKTVQVGGTTFTATHAVALSTGSAPAIPPIPGLAQANPWTSRDATSSHTVPERLAILGGGVIGVEMAFAYQGLGSQVTLLERSERVLVGQEPEVSKRVVTSLREKGVDVRTNASASQVDRANGIITITLGDGSTLHAEEVLVALGRRPSTDDLGLETVGLEPGSWLSVDDTLLVDGTDWLYAVGDLNHRALLTHMGKYQARAAGTVIADRAHGRAITGDWTKHSAVADHHVVPQVVFSEPPISSVGLTEAAARVAGLDVRTVSYEIGNTAGGSLFVDDNRGWAQLVLDGEHLVGATFYGAGVTEMVHAATVAIVGRVPVALLWHAVPSYPTMTEVWLRLLDQLPRT